jgi:hypothetical protein
MRGKFGALRVMTLSFCWIAVFAITASCAADTPRMTSQELKGRLDESDVLIIDVRAEGSWKGSDSKIKGAVREDPSSVQNWIKNYPKEKTLVFYCS